VGQVSVRVRSSRQTTVLKGMVCSKAAVGCAGNRFDRLQPPG